MINRFRPVTALIVAAAFFAAAMGANASVAIYHDPGSIGVLQGNLLYNLVTHFDDDAAVLDVTGYAAGDLAGFDAAIYAGSTDCTLPAAFLSDVAAGGNKVLWVFANFWQLDDELGGSDPFGFRFDDWVEDDGRSRIYYKGREMVRDDVDLSYNAVTVTGTCNVYSELIQPGQPAAGVPHFVCGGGLCYLAENPLYFIGQDDRYWVLADLLHEFFETGAADNPLAMVRLEDLSPGNCMPNRLKNLADWFEGHDIPFSFGLIPVMLDPLGVHHGGVPFEAHLVDDPGLVDALTYMVAHGGTMIMHGITHQHGDQITGAGWEFLDDATMLPLTGESAQWVRDRIEWGLAELEDAGFRPRIWETPHYGASHGTYHVVGEYFETMYERPYVWDLPPDAPAAWEYDGAATGQCLPYYTPVNCYGLGNLPENLGYIYPDDPNYTPDGIIAAAQRLSIVRDAVAVFFYHHTVYDPALMKDTVEGIQDLGFTFVGPDHFVSHRTDPWLDDDDDASDDDTGDDDIADDDTGDDTGDDDIADDDITDDDTGDDDSSDDDAGDDDSSGDDDDDDGGCGC